MEAALRGMDQANMDLGVMQETKITDSVYTRVSAGYRVVAKESAEPAPRRDCTVLQEGGRLRGRGGEAIWAKRHKF